MQELYERRTRQGLMLAKKFLLLISIPGVTMRMGFRPDYVIQDFNAISLPPSATRPEERDVSPHADTEESNAQETSPRRP